VLEQLRDGLDFVIDTWRRLSPPARQRIVIAAAGVGIYLIVAPIVTALAFRRMCRLPLTSHASAR
jgi:hypothetical protein